MNEMPSSENGIFVSSRGNWSSVTHMRGGPESLQIRLGLTQHIHLCLTTEKGNLCLKMMGVSPSCLFLICQKSPTIQGRVFSARPCLTLILVATLNPQSFTVSAQEHCGPELGGSDHEALALCSIRFFNYGMKPRSPCLCCIVVPATIWNVSVKQKSSCLLCIMAPTMVWGNL